nr:class I SAM-dependent methyltransferase [Desertimonas flava]
MLELGASSGYMTAVLKRRGNAVTAVECDENAAAELKQIADVTIVGDLNDPEVLADVKGPFDVVLAGDVLEHLNDPARLLLEAVAKLAPGGAVVLSVPNVAHIDLRLALLQGRFDYQPTGLLDATHVRFFTYESLLTLLAGAGLLVTDIERITVKAFESEITVDRDEFTQEVIDTAMAVPEAETYQFVVRAVCDIGDADVRRDSERILSTARNRATAAQAVRASGPVGEPLSEQLSTARRYLTVAERDRDAAREALERANEDADAIRADAIALRQRATDAEHELAVTRQELVAACIGEARARAELQRIAESAPSDQALLAEILESRAFRAVSRYRRVVNTVLPPGSRRRAILRPVARVVRP